MRRTLSVIAAPAALALLVGCSLLGGGEQEPAPGTTPAVEEETDPEETQEEAEGRDPEGSAQTSESAPDPESATEADGSSGAIGDSTAIEHLWVDDSWTITDEQEDLCAMGEVAPSTFSDQEGYFSCGPTAANALACSVEEGEQVLCIVNAADRQAIRFNSPAIAAEGPPAGGPEEGLAPLTVTLSDGVACSTVAHDQEQHWEGKSSWYLCDDGSELLTDETVEGTFEVGETWTVQRSVDKGAPEENAVAAVVYAGR